MNNPKPLAIVGIIMVTVILAGLWLLMFLEKRQREAKALQDRKQVQQEEIKIKQEEAPAISVRVFKVKSTDFKDVLPVMGTLKGFTEIEMKFEINGRIKEINFREGDKVKKGELLASLEQKDQKLKIEYSQNKLKTALASYNTTQKRLELQQKLYQAGAVIKAKLEEAELEVERARLEAETVKKEVELAEEELNKAYLFAPKDGVVGLRDAELGEFVTPQAKIASLMDIESVFVELGIVERDINKVKLGQRCEVLVDTYPGKIFLGKIENIQPMIEGKSRTLTVKVQVANPEGLLLPGMFSRANIFLIELKDVLVIPSSSLIILGPEMTVVSLATSKLYSLKDIEEGSAIGEVQLRKVSSGYSASDYTYILSGLEEGDLVIMEAQGELKDGVKVKVIGVEEAISKDTSLTETKVKF